LEVLGTYDFTLVVHINHGPPRAVAQFWSKTQFSRYCRVSNAPA